MKISVIDLFCGGGGATQGFIDAGANVVLAIDNWDKAIKLHELNHPDLPILNYQLGGNFQELIDLFLEFVDLEGHIHLHGSPPCQDLSNASTGDEKEGMELVNWFIELCNRFGEVCSILGYTFSWSMENVVPAKKYLDENKITNVVINSANEGVAQTRRRVFAGEGWIYEKSYHENEWKSIVDVLPHLDDEVKIMESMRGKGKYNDFTTRSQMKTITGISPFMFKFRDRFTVNTAGYVNSNNGGDEFGNMRYSRFIDQPVKTIHNNQPILRFMKDENEYSRLRTLTIDEISILMGYPNFKYDLDIVNKKDTHQIIGNMVCPPVARSIIDGIHRKKNMKTLFSNWN